MDIFSHNPSLEFDSDDVRKLAETEWLVTNGLGGYASGTINGALTRVFHGYLIAALPSPQGRTMMLNQLVEELVFPNGQVVRLTATNREEEQYTGSSRLASFKLTHGLPIWTYEVDGLTIEKRVFLPHRQNTTYVNYRVSAGSGSAILRLRPALNVRGHEAPVNTPLENYQITIKDHHYELLGERDFPPLRMMLLGKQGYFQMESAVLPGWIYDIERHRGYIWKGDLWTPGCFSAELSPGCDATLVASTERWDVMYALTPQQAWDAERERKRRLLLESHPDLCDEACRQLIWAADQFIFTPVGRPQDTARARAEGDEIRTVIAGYHWFTDWGRDTMISLEGLTLTTGRQVEASYILRTFAHYIRDGLIPNMFPEGKSEGLYHTADATLWFFHALDRYIAKTDDRHLLKQLLPKLLDIVGNHLRGTRFNIHIDHKDGLLSQGQDGYQLTWMDAKVEGWVVTPRRGKAVELNALWYNALRVLETWLRQANRNQEADGIAEHASRAKASFNEKFWNEETGYLYDVIEGEEGGPDPACRPNQLFAVSLPNPVLDPKRWEAIVNVARDRLLTPVGLRSLAPGEKDFKPKYDGDLRSRDAAYHQGTVWAWLIGPFIDAWMKVHPEDAQSARHFLEGFRGHLREACAGSISEIFDAEFPYTPRGCCAQAWSVAEVLRCFVKIGSTGLPQPHDPGMMTAGVA